MVFVGNNVVRSCGQQAAARRVRWLGFPLQPLRAKRGAVETPGYYVSYRRCIQTRMPIDCVVSFLTRGRSNPLTASLAGANTMPIADGRSSVPHRSCSSCPRLVQSVDNIPPLMS